MGSQTSSGTSTSRTASPDMTLTGCCQYLQVEDQQITGAVVGVVAQRNCVAAPVAFVPSTVHQSSCCLNPANFVRCPYYIEATGQQKKQVELQPRRRSITSQVGYQIARLFGRTSRRRRKRLNFFI